MDGLTFFLVLGLTIGVISGFFMGRTRAEWGRGRADARDAWKKRKAYRR